MEAFDHAEKIGQLVASGMTYQSIADALGVSVRSVYRWATGSAKPLRAHERQLQRLQAKRRRQK